jgi:dTDP-4-dehydrorhamnose reductase
MISTGMIKTRILIIGSNGMLGQRLVQFYSANLNIELMCASVEENSVMPTTQYKKIDITQKQEVKDLILGFFPDFVINTAAYTNVDKAESEREIAWKINVVGVENLALFCWTIDAHLIHISSDYIFDGKEGPYSENDKPNPVGYYGRSKLAGENSIRTNGVRYSIVRTNVLYGPAKYGRPDFVKWVVTSLKNKQEIKIVTDQINNPTYIDDLVAGISNIISYRKEGIYNIGGKELINRYNFTLRIARYFHLDETLIKPILTKDLNQPAARPLNSGLVNLKAETEINHRPNNIEETFRRMQEELFL